MELHGASARITRTMVASLLVAGLVAGCLSPSGEVAVDVLGRYLDDVPLPDGAELVSERVNEATSEHPAAVMRLYRTPASACVGLTTALSDSGFVLAVEGFPISAEDCSELGMTGIVRPVEGSELTGAMVTVIDQTLRLTLVDGMQWIGTT